MEFAQPQAEVPPPGKSQAEIRTFQHLKERLADRYDIDITWADLDELNRAAAQSPFILDYEARYVDTDLRLFYYQEVAILGFYQLRNKHLTSVLPKTDTRWRRVPMELRPMEAMAATMSLRDQNWLPAHARDNGAEVRVYRGPAPKEGALPRVDPMPWLVPTAEQAAETCGVRGKPSCAHLEAVVRPPADVDADVKKMTTPPQEAPVAETPGNRFIPTPPADPAVVAAAERLQWAHDRIQALEKVLSWAYFRSLKQGDHELSEAISAALMAAV